MPRKEEPLAVDHSYKRLISPIQWRDKYLTTISYANTLRQYLTTIPYEALDSGIRDAVRVLAEAGLLQLLPDSFEHVVRQQWKAA